MNSDLDPATEDVIRFLRAMLVETVNVLHEIYGPERASTILRAVAELVGTEPARLFRFN